MICQACKIITCCITLKKTIRVKIPFLCGIGVIVLEEEGTTFTVGANNFTSFSSEESKTIMDVIIEAFTPQNKLN